MILRARLVVPVVRPPIEDGAVSVTGDRIDWVGRWTEQPAGTRGTVVDLGESILLPGLINAHCHLDYTDMAGQILPPRSFTEWIKAMVALKGAWSVGEFAESWKRGADMLLRTGTTTVADIEAVPELLPELWQSTPLRVHSFRELISIKSRAAAGELVATAAREWSALPDADTRVGLSPHAPYTTSGELLDLAAQEAYRRRWRLTTHVAESEEEFEMYMYRQGAMYEWLKSQRDMSDCGRGSPVQHLERCGYLNENLLAVHVNYLWRHDAGILGRGQVSVAHCPRSHDYFRHLRFPLKELQSAGVNVCLGTDSLASVRVERGHPPRLSLLAEMKTFAGLWPGLPPDEILRMATMNGARALGRAGEMGELSEGARADLIAIPFNGALQGVGDAIVRHEGEVSSMIGGRWAVAPPDV